MFVSVFQVFLYFRFSSKTPLSISLPAMLTACPTHLIFILIALMTLGDHKLQTFSFPDCLFSFVIPPPLGLTISTRSLSRIWAHHQIKKNVVHVHTIKTGGGGAGGGLDSLLNAGTRRRASCQDSFPRLFIISRAK